MLRDTRELTIDDGIRADISPASHSNNTLGSNDGQGYAINPVPVIFMEYAIDVASACRDLGVKTVAVTAGYMSNAPRSEFYRHIDAAHGDLKAFSEEYYHRVTGAHLEPVLDTLR